VYTHLRVHLLNSVNDALEDKSKGSVQKVPVVQRGRFSVTSGDGCLEVLVF
jgi:hypothetical protein